MELFGKLEVYRFMNDTGGILLTAKVQGLRRQLLEHSLYGALKTPEHIRIFMQHHVFAVWDFMTLVKALQRQLTGMKMPWIPPHDPHLARFVNEIVLGEESDEDGRGGYSSHFELYREAMRECGADATAIDQFTHLLQCGVSPAPALSEAAVPRIAAEFVETTLAIAEEADVHEIAAAFVIGREDIIPDIFRSIVEALNRASGVSFERFLYYLDRHIQVDEEKHAPMGRYMLEKLCAGMPRKHREADSAACRALRARIALWDGILRQLG